MMKVKGKSKGTAFDAVEAASDSKHSDSTKRSSPEIEDSPAPAAADLAAATALVASMPKELDCRSSYSVLRDRQAYQPCGMLILLFQNINI